MMKKFLVLLLSATMMFSLMACGSSEPEYTDEQLACIEVYEEMLTDYNKAVDLVNNTKELVGNEELVDMMNEVSASIDTITEAMGDPANMTDEFMSEIDNVIESAYVIVNRIDIYAELLPILTAAGTGVDDEGNTYWFACNDDETVGAMIILSADQTQNVYCVGEMVVDENGVYTINDEDGYTMNMLVETVGGGLVLTLQDGTNVVMLPAEPIDVIETMLTIEETTENVNQ